MTKLYAHPFNTSAKGFYFTKPSEYTLSVLSNINPSGDVIEEYEIQFIEGELIDAELAKAWGLSQANFITFLEKTEQWQDWEKIAYIIAVGECGSDHEDVVDDPSSADVMVYEVDTMRELAEQFVDEGLCGDIPEHLENYIDYEAIARDLEIDYAQTTIAGTHYIFRWP